ncbi:MAG TPA: hypothetical protein PKC40_07650 [Saprospiraceae bacterium]|nr:hypothetical protein [Saprospiraceae bacterium]
MNILTIKLEVVPGMEDNPGSHSLFVYEGSLETGLDSSAIEEILSMAYYKYWGDWYCTDYIKLPEHTVVDLKLIGLNRDWASFIEFIESKFKKTSLVSSISMLDLDSKIFLMDETGESLQKVKEFIFNELKNEIDEIEIIETSHSDNGGAGHYFENYIIGVVSSATVSIVHELIKKLLKKKAHSKSDVFIDVHYFKLTEDLRKNISNLIGVNPEQLFLKSFRNNSTESNIQFVFESKELEVFIELGKNNELLSIHKINR